MGIHRAAPRSIEERLAALHALNIEDAHERARSGLLNFIAYTMPSFEVNWHHRVLARALNRFVDGILPGASAADIGFNRLLITAPPRHGKSQVVSRHLPAYILGRNPDAEIIAASYSATLAESMNRDVQRIIMTPQYAELFPSTQLNSKNIRTTAQGSWLRNSETFEVVGRRGKYHCAGIGGSATGVGADVGIIDDPCKGWEQAYSQAYRDKAWDWYTSVFYTRLSRHNRVLLTLTRWHEDDLAGRILARQGAVQGEAAEHWHVINLPALNEKGPDDQDPRQVGEPLWPARFPKPRLEQIRQNSERVWVALYQGRPSPPEGEVLQRDWWRFWRPSQAHVDLPDDLVKTISVDLTFKKGARNDYVAMQRWGRANARFYLLDQVHGQMGFVEQEDTFRAFCAKDPTALGKLIERAANAEALLDRLQAVIPGINLVTPKGDKMARVESIAHLVRAGNVYLPHPDEVPWVAAFIEECASFPNGTHDDQVDAMSQYLGEVAAKTQWNFQIEAKTQPHAFQIE